jgi:hypothetical protein
MFNGADFPAGRYANGLALTMSLAASSSIERSASASLPRLGISPVVYVLSWLTKAIAVATSDGAEASQEALPESAVEPLSAS